jgi:hypothetical protein
MAGYRSNFIFNIHLCLGLTGFLFSSNFPTPYALFQLGSNLNIKIKVTVEFSTTVSYRRIGNAEKKFLS